MTREKLRRSKGLGADLFGQVKLSNLARRVAKQPVRRNRMSVKDYLMEMVIPSEGH